MNVLTNSTTYNIIFKLLKCYQHTVSFMQSESVKNKKENISLSCCIDSWDDYTSLPVRCIPLTYFCNSLDSGIQKIIVTLFMKIVISYVSKD